MNLARIAFRDGDAPRIFEHAERMLDLAGDDAQLKPGAVHMLAWAEYTAGDFSGAIERFEENVELYRAARDLVGMAAELANLGDLAAEAGDLDRAGAFLGQSLDLAVSADSRCLLPSLLASAAVLAGARGRHAETLELAAAAEQQYALAGLTPDPSAELKQPRRFDIELMKCNSGPSFCSDKAASFDASSSGGFDPARESTSFVIASLIDQRGSDMMPCPPRGTG